MPGSVSRLRPADCRHDDQAEASPTYPCALGADLRERTGRARARQALMNTYRQLMAARVPTRRGGHVDRGVAAYRGAAGPAPHPCAAATSARCGVRAGRMP